MRPLRVALLIRATKPSLMGRDMREIGYFSYAVPEFEWDHVPLGKWFTLRRDEFSDYDVIVAEDDSFGYFTGEGPPVVGIFWDSTWTEHHYQDRFQQAERCDLVLIDHDDLERFEPCGRVVDRLSYCVNDKLFKLSEDRSVDVTFHCVMRHSESRRAVNSFLGEFCEQRGYTFTKGEIEDIVEYAAAFGRAKININVIQSPENRPHRVFDSMACGGCFLTSPLPLVSGESCWPGVHYVEFDGHEDLAEKIDHLLLNGHWQEYAAAGYEMVMKEHTWSVRARELRELISQHLGV